MIFSIFRLQIFKYCPNLTSMESSFIQLSDDAHLSFPKCTLMAGFVLLVTNADMYLYVDLVCSDCSSPAQIMRKTLDTYASQFTALWEGFIGHERERRSDFRPVEQVFIGDAVLMCKSEALLSVWQIWSGCWCPAVLLFTLERRTSSPASHQPRWPRSTCPVQCDFSSIDIQHHMSLIFLYWLDMLTRCGVIHAYKENKTVQKWSG